ncbi:MAG: hypothetical protein IJ121_08035 [Eubacterium sp.]|nr:hypothetical protein [Eubacterium sp.]
MREMLMMLLMLMIVIGVVRIGLKLAWGAVKILFGLGLFAVCPMLLIALVFLGFYSYGWLILIVLSWIFGRGFVRA